MKSSDYNSGQLKTAFQGKETEYKYFVPTFINHDYIPEDIRIAKQLEVASKVLGELNAYSDLVPNIDFFIQMHVRNEALKSSRIEGTQTGMDEAILPEEEISPEKRDDWREVQNYIEAMNYCVDRLKDLPITMRLLKDGHKILLLNTRGQDKSPGEIRWAQNWIGGNSINTASFIPPHPDLLPELLSDLEKFWHNRALQMPSLLRLAISHYQFETIHPFSDGNGRIGRLLITLQLIEMGIIRRPILYISDYFEKNRGNYYDGLTLVRSNSNLDQWILFFLEAVEKTAAKGIRTFKEIIALRHNYEQRIISLGRRAKVALMLLNYLYSSPAITVGKASEYLNLSINPTNVLVNKLEELSILREITGFSRNRIFVLHEYLDLFRG